MFYFNYARVTRSLDGQEILSICAFEAETKKTEEHPTLLPDHDQGNRSNRVRQQAYWSNLHRHRPLREVPHAEA